MEITYPYNAAWKVTKHLHEVNPSVPPKLTARLEDLTNGYTTGVDWDDSINTLENCLRAMNKYCNPLNRTVLASAEIERFSDKGFVFLVQIDPLSKGLPGHLAEGFRAGQKEKRPRILRGLPRRTFRIGRQLSEAIHLAEPPFAKDENRLHSQHQGKPE